MDLFAVPEMTLFSNVIEVKSRNSMLYLNIVCDKNEERFLCLHWTFSVLSKVVSDDDYVFPFQYFVQNNIAYDPEYVFYDIKVSRSIWRC